MTADVQTLADAHARVLERIAAACGRVGRDPSEVTLVAVSKTVAAERVRAAVAAGITVLGENRVQEAETKVPAVEGAAWHLVGPLQSNKARRALEVFSMIQTVHRADLAVRLDMLCRETSGDERYPVLLQVNVDRDPAKAGFQPEALAAAAESLDTAQRLDFRGLMTVGRQFDDPSDARATFAALRARSDAVRAAWPRLGPDLSMGMSDDFEIAVEEGATIVRIGRAIFGDRPDA